MPRREETKDCLTTQQLVYIVAILIFPPIIQHSLVWFLNLGGRFCANSWHIFTALQSFGTQKCCWTELRSRWNNNIQQLWLTPRMDESRRNHPEFVTGMPTCRGEHPSRKPCVAEMKYDMPSHDDQWCLTQNYQHWGSWTRTNRNTTKKHANINDIIIN